jgi:hypothetical protein
MPNRDLSTILDGLTQWSFLALIGLCLLLRLMDLFKVKSWAPDFYRAFYYYDSRTGILVMAMGFFALIFLFALGLGILASVFGL